MRIVSRLFGGLRNLFHKDRAERELDEELRQYVDAAIEQKQSAEVGSLAGGVVPCR